MGEFPFWFSIKGKSLYSYSTGAVHSFLYLGADYPEITHHIMSDIRHALIRNTLFMAQFNVELKGYAPGTLPLSLGSITNSAEDLRIQKVRG